MSQLRATSSARHHAGGVRFVHRRRLARKKNARARRPAQTAADAPAPADEPGQQRE
jgi:hypothetical protein